MTTHAAFAVHAVVRNRRTDKALDVIAASRGGGPGCTWIEDGGLAAAVTPVPAEEEADRDEMMRRHGRIVAALLGRSGVVPLPFGVRARDENAVRTLLRNARIPLVEALDFLDDHYEVRVHFRGGGRRRDEAGPVGRAAFAELRQMAKAARILLDDGDVLDAAFLVRRPEWIQFVETASDWESRVPGTRVDTTGPWAAYDFVRVHLPGRRAARGDGWEGGLE